VQDVQPAAFDFQLGGRGELRRPWPVVDVAADGGDRRDAFQPFQEAGVADVSRMDDPFNPPKRFDGFRPEQAVGVRDETDSDPSVLPARASRP